MVYAAAQPDEYHHGRSKQLQASLPLRARRGRHPVAGAQWPYRPRQQLRPQHEFARELGVSFTTLKQALDLLTDEGYVVRHVGFGTYASLPARASDS